MKRSFFSAVAVCFLVIGCTTKQETVEITLPQEIKAAIEKAAPTKDFGFYGLKASYPRGVDELKEWSLIVCGGRDHYMDIDVTMSSLSSTKALLFKSSKRYSISNNIFGPNPEKPSATESVSTITTREGAEIPIDRQGLIFGRDMTPDRLFAKCLKDVQENQKAILLAQRDLGAGKQKDLVEIVFK
jgi:hypothetical protein